MHFLVNFAVPNSFKIISSVSTLLILAMPVGAQALEDDAQDVDVGTQLRAPILAPPEEELPTSPESLEKEKAEKVLSGAAESEAIQTSAELIIDSPLSRYKGDSLKFLRVRVKNTGKSPMLILGNKSSLNPIEKQTLSGISQEHPVSATKLEDHDNSILTGKQKTAVALIGVGSLGLAGPLAYERMNKGEYRERNLGIALGRDAGRHEVESERLGTRLILPGDFTEGWAAFPEANFDKASGLLYLPIMYPPYTRISGTLKIPIK